MRPEVATSGSPLLPGAGVMPLPRYVAAGDLSRAVSAADAAAIVSSLNATGYWPAKLGMMTHPFKRQGVATVAPGDFSQTQVGDDTDTSPFPDADASGISTEAYIRNMGALIRFLQRPPQSAATWRIDNLTRIGGHPVTVLGAPRVVDTPHGKAVEFDGEDDGLLLDVNPIAGLTRFRLEIAFAPAAGGPGEQRFLHIEETGSPSRALVELRMLGANQWCLDTYLRDGPVGLALLDWRAAHAADEWHVAALAYDGRTMTSYVDGVRQSAGDVRFSPLGDGRTSIGVRLNRVSWFKGRIREIQIIPSSS